MTSLALSLLLSPVFAGEQTVASVNGAPILLATFKQEYGSAVDNWRRAGAPAASAVDTLKKMADMTLERLIDREVLCQEGEKLKIEVTEADIGAAIKEVGAKSFSVDEAGRPLTEEEAEKRFNQELVRQGLTFDVYKKRLARQILAQKTLARQIKEASEPPSEKEAKALLEKVKAFLRSGLAALPKGMDESESLTFQQFAAKIKTRTAEAVRISRILIKFPRKASAAQKAEALKAAQAIRKQLDGGASFETLAKEKSQDEGSAAEGGDMGFFTRGQILPEIEKAAFKLPVGALDGPVSTPLGYNVIRVTGHRAAETPDFGTYRVPLMGYVAELHAHKAAASYVESLKAKAGISRQSAVVAGLVSDVMKSFPAR